MHRRRPPPSPASLSRRSLLTGAAWAAGAVALGRGSFVVPPAWGQSNPIKVGIATDLTGPIGFAGKANANVATMVVNDINAKGGVLGRSLQLIIEDTASNESVAVNNVRKLIQRDRVDVVFGGITSSMRNAIKDVIVTRGRDALHLSPALRGPGVHAVHLLHRPDPRPAVRRVHPVADQERRQALRAALRELRLAQAAQPVRAQGHPGQRRRGRVRGVLPPRPGRVQRDREQDHDQQRERGLQHRHPARRRARSSSSSTRPASPSAADGCPACTTTRTR